jgi:hypothetical protein
MTLNKNVLKNISGEITDGILLNGDAQKIKVITGGEITCPLRNSVCTPAKLPCRRVEVGYEKNVTLISTFKYLF